MKIREGFVSNSSSSSFVLVGREISKEEVINKLLQSQYPASIYVAGKWLGEGQDIFKLSGDVINGVLNTDCKELTFYESYFAGNGEEGVPINVSKLPITDDLKAFNFEMDQHSTENYTDFIEIYVNDRKE